MDIETRNYINDLAQQVIISYSISVPITNIDEIVHKIGGTIEEKINFDDLCDGTIIKDGNNSFRIAISPFQNEQRRSFTIAHELGHLFLHMGFRTNLKLWENQKKAIYRRFGSSAQEYQANEFAASLLMPKDVYWRILKQNAVDNRVDIATLLDAIDAIFEVTQRIFISLKNGKFFDSLEDQSVTSEEILFLKHQNTLSVKATAWIAVINDKINSSFDNVVFDYSASSHNQSIREFLGKDIDTGFRLKEYTQDRRLCISIELAYFLMKNGKQKNLKIMDYVRLKGVWNDNLYPIIWYYSPKIVRNCQLEMTGHRAKTTFEKSFRYDESDKNQIVKKYFLRIQKKLSDLNYDENGFANNMYVARTGLQKIIYDRCLQEKLDYIQSCFKKEVYMIQSDPYAHPLELHCAVVCCDVQQRKILITRRGSEHTTNPEKWEFGCAKASSTEKLEKSIVDYYRK